MGEGLSCLDQAAHQVAHRGYNGGWLFLWRKAWAVGWGDDFAPGAHIELNEWYERESDAKMRRTSRRPLPSGRIEPIRALIFGIVLAVLGAGELAWAVNLRTTIIGSTTIAAYLFVYTPLKRVLPALHKCSGICGRYASADRVRGGKWKLERGSMGSRRDSFRVADSALARNRVDVS